MTKVMDGWCTSDDTPIILTSQDRDEPQKCRLKRFIRTPVFYVYESSDVSFQLFRGVPPWTSRSDATSCEPVRVNLGEGRTTWGTRSQRVRHLLPLLLSTLRTCGKLSTGPNVSWVLTVRERDLPLQGDVCLTFDPESPSGLSTPIPPEVEYRS